MAINLEDLTQAQQDYAQFLVMDEIPLTVDEDMAEMEQEILADVALLSDADCIKLLKFATS